MLKEEEYLKLNALEEDIINDLDSDDVIHYLQSNRVLNEADIYRLNTEGNSRSQKTRILVGLLRQNLKTLQPFIDALIFARYSWLVRAMTSSGPTDPSPETRSNNTSPDVQQPGESPGNSPSGPPKTALDQNGSVTPKDPKRPRLSTSDASTSAVNDYRRSPDLYALAVKGKIPKRPDVHVHRKNLFNRLKDLVCGLEHQLGWVIIHGMSGSGKSVLAAEVASDERILGKIFPQIFWINFDKDKNPEKKFDEREEKAVLLAKFHFLYSHVINKNTMLKNEPLQNIDDALLKLPDLLIRNFPRTLLVLDDIWSPYHVKKFDELPCRFLVTTQNESVMHEVNGAKFFMPMNPSGFTRQETMEAFAKWLQCSVEQLPAFAALLFEESDGHPFFISLVGSLLRAHKNRWTYYYNQIRQENLKGIKSETSVNTYKHKSFSEAASSSLSDLSGFLKQKYLDLAVFPLKSNIPAKVLGVFWQMDVTKVEDLMDQLVRRDLVSKNFNDRLDCDVYTVHNLLHLFLKEAIIDEQCLKDMHHRFVMMYHNFTKGKWGFLPKDEYIHRYIGIHLEGSQLYLYFSDVYLNLKFLYDKSRECGFENVLKEFGQYSNYIRQKDETLFEEFRQFLEKSAQILSSAGGDHLDLLQLALREPLESTLHRAATNLV